MAEGELSSRVSLVGGLLVPLGGLLWVPGDTGTFFIHVTEGCLTLQVSLFRSPAHPEEGERLVRGDSLSSQIHLSESPGGFAISLTGSLAAPLSGFLEIDGSAHTILIEVAEDSLGLGPTFFRRSPDELEALVAVLLHPAAEEVVGTQLGLGLGIILGGAHPNREDKK